MCLCVERLPKTVGVSVDGVQLTSKDPVSFTDLRKPQLSLASAGIHHGDIVSNAFSCRDCCRPDSG